LSILNSDTIIIYYTSLESLLLLFPDKSLLANNFALLCGSAGAFPNVPVLKSKLAIAPCIASFYALILTPAFAMISSSSC
jgi:hypothetical protein